MNPCAVRTLSPPDVVQSHVSGYQLADTACTVSQRVGAHAASAATRWPRPCGDSDVVSGEGCTVASQVGASQITERYAVGASHPMGRL